MGEQPLILLNRIKGQPSITPHFTHFAQGDFFLLYVVFLLSWPSSLHSHLFFCLHTSSSLPLVIQMLCAQTKQTISAMAELSYLFAYLLFLFSVPPLCLPRSLLLSSFFSFILYLLHAILFSPSCTLSLLPPFYSAKAHILHLSCYLGYSVTHTLGSCHYVCLFCNVVCFPVLRALLFGDRSVSVSNV